MRIFIWKSYGDVTVYMADTTLCLKAIYKKISDVLNNMNSEEIVGKVDKMISENLHKYDEDRLYEAAIKRTITLFGIDTHESFEYGTGFSQLEDPLDEE